MTEVRPRNETHALMSVAFALHFDAPFLPEMMSTLDRALQSNLKAELPRRTTEPPKPMFPTGPAGMAFSPPVLIYDRVAPDGSVAQGVKIHGNAIVFLLGNYERWAKSWPQVEGALIVLLEAIGSNARVMMLGTEYIDQFFAGTDGAEFNPRSILREGSRLVPSHVFTRHDNWHAYTGFFEHGVHPLIARLLSRVNIDLNDSEMPRGKMMQIRLLHEAFFDGITVPELLAGSPRKLSAAFSAIHSADKRILSETLNDSMCSRIQLNWPQPEGAENGSSTV